MGNKRFGLIGAAGYVAPRHMKAISETDNHLVAALDRSDSVGVIDRFFPEVRFFTEFERFDRHIDKLRRQNASLDFLSVCSPNYLHDAHCRFGLRNNIDVICEKPLVLNPWNIDALQEIERETGRNINNILQLRLHPAIIKLKKKIDTGPVDKVYDVDLAYLTARGPWYMVSWKGELQKSGGIATNIGVHFYDMLSWVFGKQKENIVHVHELDQAAGFMEFEKARVRWFLSVNIDYIPKKFREQGKRTYRSMTIDGDEIEFSDGFTDLHTESYKKILERKGFGTEEVRPSIEIVHDIRNRQTIGKKGSYHPLLDTPKQVR